MNKAQLSDPISFLNKIGLNPWVANRRSLHMLAVPMFLVYYVLISSFMELTFHYNGLETLARASESMLVQYQVCVKIIILLTNKNDLRQLVNDTTSFWSLKRFGPGFVNKFAHTHKLMRYFFLLYKTMMVLMTLQYITSKLIFRSGKPLAISYGEGTGLTPRQDQIIYVVQSGATVAVYFIIVGFDGLFFYFIGHVLAELRMIKIAFERFQHKQDVFYEAIRHHIVALRFINNLNRLYSNLLFNQHASCLFGICFGLFLLSKDGTPPDLKHMGRYLPYVVVFAFQTFTFCFIGSLISDWSLEVPDAIFYSGWSSTVKYKYKNDKLIAMIRGQRAAKLTLGRFGRLDLYSFTLVVKNAFSFFTFVNAINEKLK